MNLKLDESGIRVRLSPGELSALAQVGKLCATFPLGEKAAWKCELNVGSPFDLVVGQGSVLVKVPEEMLRSLEQGVASGKKAGHEISRAFEGTQIFLEVDYFQSRSKAATGEEGRASEHR